MRKKKAYRVTKNKTIFKRGFIHLIDCKIKMGSGKVLARQIFEHPGAVVIIPRISKERYLLVRQFRFAARAWLWEFPAGGIEPGENLKAAAAREMMEETGFRPRKIKPLYRFYPTPGVSSEVMHVFLAEDLVPESADKDEDEEIELGNFSLSEIGKMIRAGEICDGKTMLGYYFLLQEMPR